jgi:hypothetical protein
MSSATTNAQAIAEFVSDMKRLNPKRQDFLNAVDAACVEMQQNTQTSRRMIQESVSVFLATKEQELEQHIDADLTAKEAVRGAFDAKPAGK